MDAVTVNKLWCKGCGICVAFCPAKALELKEGKSTPVPGLCTVCGMCERYCPDLAVSVDLSRRPKKAAAETEPGAAQPSGKAAAQISGAAKAFDSEKTSGPKDSGASGKMRGGKKP